MHLVVFDIDGTLVDSDEFDGRLYAQAVMDVLGIEIDCTWDRYANVTDSGILDEVLDVNAISGNRAEIHARVRREFLRQMRDYVACHPRALREIPGAKQLVDTLCLHGSVSVAIATGGWRETAILKLQGIGIDAGRIPLATASDSSDRCEIIKIAEGRAGLRKHTIRKTYFGDGAWDKKAAVQLNYAFIGVGPKVIHGSVVPDLADRAAILEQLGV